MKKELNYNYAFLFYDVGEKRVQKVFKICKKYLSHIQNSVFEGEISKVQLVKLQQELKVYIDSNLDSVILFKSRQQKWLDKEFWGKEDDKIHNKLRIDLIDT